MHEKCPGRNWKISIPQIRAKNCFHQKKIIFLKKAFYIDMFPIKNKKLACFSEKW